LHKVGLIEQGVFLVENADNDKELFPKETNKDKRIYPIRFI
jgi:hypothetical protein